MSRLRRIVAGFLTLFLLLTTAPVPSRAAALEQLDQSQTQQEASQQCKASYACAQVFTAGLTGALTRARVMVDRDTSGSGDMVVELRALSAGEPTGTTLASRTILASAVPAYSGPGGNPTWVDVTFSPAPTVTAGTQYALYVSATGTAQYNWYNAKTDPYGGGMTWLQTSVGGPWGSHPAFDLAFETYVTPLPNAQLSALSLSQGTLSPAFDKDTYSYSVTVPNATSSVTLSPTPADPAATVKVNGNAPSTPVNLSGAVTNISVVVTATDGVTKATYTVAVRRNSLPTISSVAPLSVPQGSSTPTINFTVGDAETDVTDLTVAASSLNEALIPTSGILLGGSGANRTLQATPAPNKSGTAVLEVQVSDGMDVKTQQFTVHVTDVNDPPSIQPIADQTWPEDAPIDIPITIDDPDGPDTVTVTATSSDTTLVPNANLKVTGTGANRTLTVTPGALTGTTTITVTAADGANSVSTSFQLTLTSANDAPVIGPLANKTILEDSPLSFTFSVSDEESPAGSLSVAVTSSDTALVPNSFSVTNTNGLVTVTGAPAADQSGTTTITVAVDDGVRTSTASFDLTVSPVNDPPVIGPISDASTNEDVAFGPIAFTLSDVDTPVTDLTVTPTSSNQAIVPNANIVIGGSGANRTVTITPAPDQNGTVTITLKASDGTSTSTRTFTLTVVPVNDPPTISNIADVVAAQDQPVPPIAFTVSDLETVASQLQVTATSSNQALVPNANMTIGGASTNRTLSVSPVPGQTGSTTITLSVSDGSAVATTSFVLTVKQAPTISALPDVQIDEDSVMNAIAFTVGDAEVPASALNVTATSNNQALVPNANIALGGSGANRTIAITPTANGYGTATITVTVDNGTVTASRTFKLTVNPINDAPAMSKINDLATAEDTSTGPIPFTVSDLETPTNKLVISATSNNQVLVPDTAITVGGSGNNRTIAILPAKDLSGIATITVTLSDGEITVTQSFVLTVTAVNDPPTISSPNSPSVMEDSTGSFTLTAADVDSPVSVLTLQVTSLDPAKIPDGNIVVTQNAPGTWSIQVTPLPNQSGVCQLQVTVSDGITPGVKTIPVNILEVNDPPWITGTFPDIVIDEDTTASGITFTVGDIETAPGSLNVYATSTNPTLLPVSAFGFGGSGANRTLNITPGKDQYGSAVITVWVSDGVDQASASFNITVNPVPDPPRIENIGDKSIKEDTSWVQQVQIVAPDSNLADVTIAMTSDNPQLVPDSQIVLSGTGVSRTLTVTPLPEASGVARITFTLSDGVLTGTQTVTLTVEEVNDFPVISIISDRQIWEDGTTGPIPFTVGDMETPADQLVVTADSSNPEIVPNVNIAFGGAGPARTVTVTPAPNQYGRVTITVRVSDGQAAASESFQLTIDGINDAPSFTVGPNQIVDEDAGPQTIQNWATNVSAGPYETDQTATFTVQNTNPALFAVQPAVDSKGTLTYTPAANTYGVATVTLRLHDNGGTANGGVDTSAEQSFTITVNPVNDPPTITEIPGQGTEVGVPTKWITFFVDDVESGPNTVWVTASSSNQALVRDDNIVVTGTGPERQVRVTPQPGRIGTVTITLTAHDPDGGTSSVSFPLVINDVHLSELETETGLFTPVFDSNTLDYTVVYTGTVTTMWIRPTAIDPAVTIYVNGVETPSGEESAPVGLTDNGGFAEVRVEADTGISRTYTLRFVRALSKITDLASLSVEPGTLSPAFDPAITRYTVDVDYYTTQVTVNAQPGDGRSRMEITGGDSLKVGANKISILVRAENGEQKVYEITVNRGKAPLTMRDVLVEPGARWATVHFRTSDTVSATVTYREGQKGEERTERSTGTDHSVLLRNLQPMTTYTFRIVATRGDESVDYTSTFMTPAPTAADICVGGEISAESARSVTMRCPSNEGMVEPLSHLSAEAAGASTTTITDLEMKEALTQAGILKRTEEPATLVIYTGSGGTSQAALIDKEAVARAARMGADVEVRSPAGSLTLPSVVLATLSESTKGKLVVLFEEVDPGVVDLKAHLKGGQLKPVSPLLDVSVATVYDDGRVEKHDRFAAPLKLALKVDPAAAASPEKLGVYWLRESTPGRVVERTFLGGQVDREQGTITVIRDHLSKYVVLSFEGQFKDVTRSHWAYETIQLLAARQVVWGLTPDTFEPETPVTRAQFAVWLVRALGLQTDARFAYVYTDIRRDDPLAAEIGGAVLNGLMLGYPDGTFHPDQILSRQELAVVLHRLATRFELPTGMSGIDYKARLQALQDWNAVATWAQESVRFTISNGLMTGRSADAFSPEGIATRAEAATVVRRMADLVAKLKQR